jgi:hypothetical protein
MSSPHAPGKQAKPSAMRRLASLVEGKIGILIIGAALTAITSVALPWWFSRLDQARQAHQHELEAQTQALADARKDREAQARALTQKIDDPVLQRLAATEFMIQLHGRQATDDEVRGAWANYWSAYQNYFVFAEGNQVPADRLTANGPQAGYLDQHPVLWTYLTTVIAPEFARIHSCLVSAHETYDPKTAKPNTGSDAQFRNCLGPGPGDNPFWNKPLDDTNVRDPWDRFKDCAATFLIQIQFGLEWREQLAEEEPAPEIAHATRLAECPPGYSGDQLCRQMRYNADVFEQMGVDCGPLARRDVEALDLPEAR